jgi:hypothetical protein
MSAVDNGLVMLTPKGYLGGNWCGVITSLQSLRDARRLRKLIKQRPDIIINIKNDSRRNDYFVAYAHPPRLLWDKDHALVVPDLRSMLLHRELSERSRNAIMPPVNITYTYSFDTGKKPMTHLDSENLIGEPL